MHQATDMPVTMVTDMASADTSFKENNDGDG
jgi:hypothetical protein